MLTDWGNVDLSKFLDTILEGEKIRNRKKSSHMSYLMGTIDNLDRIDNILREILKIGSMSRLEKVGEGDY